MPEAFNSISPRLIKILLFICHCCSVESLGFCCCLFLFSWFWWLYGFLSSCSRSCKESIMLTVVQPYPVSRSRNIYRYICQNVLGWFINLEKCSLFLVTHTQTTFSIHSFFKNVLLYHVLNLLMFLCNYKMFNQIKKHLKSHKTAFWRPLKLTCV